MGSSPSCIFSRNSILCIFVDDCTRFTWIYPVKKKSVFFAHFVIFHKLVENLFSKKLKTFQCDGGGEFNSLEFTSYLDQHGIQRHISCPYTPEQNGVAEWKHRHIVETGLILIFNANLPIFLWVEAFMTAVFLINRMPTSTLKMASPFTKLFGQNLTTIYWKFLVADVPYLKGYNKDKFQPKTFPCIFIGYNLLHKGYWCYHPESRRVYISRHVIFDESILPYSGSSPNEHANWSQFFT